MQYHRMPIEVESPEELGYSTIKYNLAESSIADKRLSDYGIDNIDALLAYIPHRGDDALRQEIIANSDSLHIDDVLVTAGAAMALFVVATALLSKDDHIVVIRPNYASNIETPKAIGCGITYINLKLEHGWQLDLEEIKESIKSNTKIISLTCPHNPTGVVFHHDDLMTIIQIAASQGICVLMDETYRELNFKSTLRPYYASYYDNVVSVASMSKSYGVPGIRIGWLITQNKKWMYHFLAAKEQIMLSNPVLEEKIALSILSKRQFYKVEIHRSIQENFSLLNHWLEMQNDILDYVLPDAGVVCFPKVKDLLPFNFNYFQKALYEENSTLVGYGHWFDMDDRYMRIGFGYPNKFELEDGLTRLSKVLRHTNS
jgi:aspartate/methionine/tyrosine aminotransferase